jgi:hypothetical protein
VSIRADKAVTSVILCSCQLANDFVICMYNVAQHEAEPTSNGKGRCIHKVTVIASTFSRHMLAQRYW